MSGFAPAVVAIAIVLAALLGAAHLLDGYLRYGGTARQRRVQGAKWAGRRDLRDLEVEPGEPGRVVLGRHRGKLIGTVGQASAIIVGPSRISYKTTGLTIPAVLEWQGPVVVVSVKSDLLLATRARRSQMGGKTMVFDPTGSTGLGTVKATPLVGCGTWRGAMRIAHMLCASARISDAASADGEFWYAAAEKLLAPLLLAAATREEYVERLAEEKRQAEAKRKEAEEKRKEEEREEEGERTGQQVLQLGDEQGDEGEAAAEAPKQEDEEEDPKGSMATVVRWLNDGQGVRVRLGEQLRKLAEMDEEEGSPRPEKFGGADALSAWEAHWKRDKRQASSIGTTAETVVRAYADPRVQEASSRPDYTPEHLLDGRANTLYLCSPAHEQERLRIVFATMLSELIGVVYERSAKTGEPIDPPLLMVLDEVANAAPIPDLDVLAATGAGQGIQLLTAAQDLAQMQARWGQRAETIFNNHQAKLFAPGNTDSATLRYVSHVLGEGEFRERSETAAEQGRGSSTEGSTYRPLAPANVLREGKPGTALFVYGHRPATWIGMRPWFETPELLEMVKTGER